MCDLDRCTPEDAALLREAAAEFDRKAALFDGVLPHFAVRLRGNSEQICGFADRIEAFFTVSPLA